VNHDLMVEKIKTICFVVPEYRRDTPTHFNHVYDLVREVSKLMDIYVYIERAEGVIDFLGAKEVLVAKSKNKFLSFMESIKIFYCLRRFGVSDFYVHYSFRSACAALLVTKAFGGRVFYWNCGEPWKYKRNFFREFFERLVYKMIDYLVTGTESLKENYAAEYGISKEKIKVMPNWIDIEKFKVQSLKLQVDELRNSLNLGVERKIVLFAHRLSKRKGAHYLAEIIKALKNEKAVFIIIGDGSERRNVKLKIENWKLGDRVRWLGWVPNSDISLYYALADVFIMPSDEEGFPRVLLEAMVMGKPFVAFDVGGVREIIPPECQEFVVAGGSVEQFVKKVKTLLMLDSGGKEPLQRAELVWTEQFDVKKIALAFQQLFI